MSNNKKTHAQLFNELSDKLGSEDREKLLLMGDKLLSYGQRLEYERISKILTFWNKFNNGISEEVNELLDKIKEYWK